MLVSCGGSGDGGEASVTPSPIAPAPTPVPTPAPSPTSPPTTVDTTTLPADPAATTISFAASAMSPQPRRITGIGVHLAQAGLYPIDPERTLALIAAQNNNSFRDDIYWNAFAPSWDPQGSHLEPALKAALDRTDMMPVLILNNGNPAIEGTNPPITEAARQEFAKFAGRAVRAVGQRPVIYEIFNEWNLRVGDRFNKLVGAGEAGDARAAQYYVPLAKAATAAVRAANPQATVIVGTPADDPDWEWSKAVVRGGALENADGFGLHLYAHCNVSPWNNATALIGRLERARAALNEANGGREVPIYVTEFGWPNTSVACGFDAATVGAYTAQFTLYAAAQPWIRGTWSYQLRDQATDAADLEMNFGLYDAQYREKPSACAPREANALLAEAEAATLHRPSPDLFVLTLRTATDTKLIAWTSRAGQTGSVRVGGTIGYTSRPLCGTAVAGSADRLVQVGVMPVVVSVPTLQLMALQARAL
ncbi:hypothetical protein COC42_16620 [Sphingomonas spermidinifaciens]|uniref:Glycoside hydrolase family 5 domain-containing protein n=1 Tax=Sphingomonas spermidinifaciens TaxID=1141889 RepID=A0A2A4B192_9SPHN|nr:hypothetical protein COC42_16620 [Sphingomonas spermidinifaciens]